MTQGLRLRSADPESGEGLGEDAVTRAKSGYVWANESVVGPVALIPPDHLDKMAKLFRRLDEHADCARSAPVAFTNPLRRADASGTVQCAETMTKGRNWT
jgi:hypothetical protein